MDNIFINDDLFLKHLEQQLERENLAKQEEIFRNSSRIPAFTEKQSSSTARKKRKEKCRNDFFFWDKTYFPPDVITNYAEPGAFHHDLISITELRDKKAHIVMGPRLVIKTSLLKRKMIYDFLYAKRKFMGFGSGTLKAPKAFLYDVYMFLSTNPRIKADYKLKWLKISMEDGLHLVSDVSECPEGSFIDALSEERTTRGGQRNLIDRYDYILFTDIENETSSYTIDAVQKRIDRINEMRTSLEDWGTVICEGNNISVDTAQNKLKEEKETGLLSEYFDLHIYPAWDNSRPGKYKSIWYAKYPAESEEEMKALMKPKDGYDWAGGYQQAPKLRGSDIFPEEFYQEWDFIPYDCKCVSYTDPNLSKKGKGDTTATGVMGFSTTWQGFYIPEIICKSYSDPNDLIEDTLKMRERVKENHLHVRLIGFDGNVNQESHWTSHVKNFAKLKDIPIPPIEYKNYSVDALIKTAETIYKNREVYFPKGFKTTETGKVFLKQFHNFKGKKAGKKDDAPDWFCCILEFLFELHLVFYKHVHNFDNAIKSVSQRKLADRI